MIYTFGNSHAHLFTGSNPGTSGFGEIKDDNFTSFSLGPVIAYNFSESHYPKVLDVLDNLKINKKTDFIMLIVGEVDCRWHLPLQASIQNRTIESVVDECVDRLFLSYLNLVEIGYKVIGWGGHPSTTSGHNDDMNQPVFGDCINRNRISRYWNNSLKSKCEKHNIEYISIIDDLIDDNGLTKMEYFMDYCHLNPIKAKNIYIKNFINKNII
jgi:hypothetical protein